MEDSMNRVRALVIDDEKSIRVSLGRALEDMGLEVQTAATGEEGVEKSSSGLFSIVMLDLKLPGIGGLEVLRQIRSLGRPPSVVIISAHGTVNSAVAAMRLGAADFIQKPFSLEEVRAVVGEILTRSDLDEGASDYESLLSLARRAITRKEFELAEDFTSKAIAVGASRPEAYNLLGSLLEIRGEKAQAMKFYRAALDMDPTYSPARANFERA
jgi:DNA-binding response OmpR family regulator